jgi:hypothetical protein
VSGMHVTALVGALLLLGTALLAATLLRHVPASSRSGQAPAVNRLTAAKPEHPAL